MISDNEVVKEFCFNESAVVELADHAAWDAKRMIFSVQI
jgi:hypothetical protein